MAFFRGTGGAGTATFEQLPLAISEGGTSATTTASARVALLPSLSGNASKSLTVNVGETDVEFVAVASTETVTSSILSQATANFTGVLQNGGSNVVVDTDIGSTVQAHDADTAKLDTTANFTVLLQQSASNVLKASDLGVLVQAYDADTAKLDAATANFTGVLQDGGSTVLTVSSTIEGGTYS